MATKCLLGLAFVLAIVYGLFVKNIQILQTIVVHTCILISTAVVLFYMLLNSKYATFKIK